MKAAYICLSFGLAFAHVLGSGGDGPEWAYHSKSSSILSPKDWAAGYPDCGGVRQSPIDIVNSEIKKSCTAGNKKSPLTFSGDCSVYDIRVLPETYKWEAKKSTCKVHLHDKSFSLLQLHMHTPSEHTIDGESFDGETHFVHKEDDGDGYLVIGLFMKATDIPKNDAPWIDAVWKSLGSVNETASHDILPSAEVPYTYAELVQEEISAHGVFNYPGSLTTPPCSEVVDWWVVKSPIEVHEDEMAKFKDHLIALEATDEGAGARPVQPLLDRKVTKY